MLLTVFLAGVSLGLSVVLWPDSVGGASFNDGVPWAGIQMLGSLLLGVGGLLTLYIALRETRKAEVRPAETADNGGWSTAPVRSRR